MAIRSSTQRQAALQARDLRGMLVPDADLATLVDRKLILADYPVGLLDFVRTRARRVDQFSSRRIERFAARRVERITARRVI